MPIPATTGQLRTKLEDMEIGDYIVCRYTAATSGQAGTFSELGTCTATEIPVTGSTTPDGLFYFIKADQGLCIADRVVQHSISWDTLNAANYIEGRIIVFDITLQCQIIDGGHIENRNLAFDNTIGGYATTAWEAPSPTRNGWVGQDFQVPKCIKVYSLAATSDYPLCAPRDFTFEGSDDMNTWEIINTHTNLSFTAAERKLFFINTVKAYRYYRINVTQIGINANSDYLSIAEIEMGEHYGFIRSLSGGCAYLGNDENSSLTDCGLGAWPSVNEWDKYIVKSDLKGKITPGDDNVWHHKNIMSWCQDTPINAVFKDKSGTTFSSTSAIRMLRGYENRAIYGNISFTGSNGSYTHVGFRPILEYLEPNSRATTLWY